MKQRNLIAIIALAFASITLHAETTPPPAPPQPPGQTAVATPPPAPAAPVAPAAANPAAPVQRREEEEGAPSLSDRIKAFMNRDGDASTQAKIRQLTEANQQLQQQLNEAQTKAEQYGKELAKIESLLKAEQQTVKATATEIFASIGIPQEKLPAPKSAEQTIKTKTRGEFEALSHPDRNAFMASGGKIEG